MRDRTVIGVLKARLFADRGGIACLCGGGKEAMTYGTLAQGLVLAYRPTRDDR